MRLRYHPIRCTLVVSAALFCQSLWAEENAAESGKLSVPAVADLTKTEIDQAAKSDDLTLPMPGEFFAAIGKRNRPNWTLFYRTPLTMNYSNRAQIALNLGGLIADGYIAVEAQDGRQVKNIGKDIIALAKQLGVSQNVLGRGNSITDFAENNEWNALKEELEATQNDVRSAMSSMEDQDLVILVNLGGWVRGTEVVSSVVAQNYDPDDAKLLRQPAIIDYMMRQIDLLPQTLQDDSLIQELKKQLLAVREQVAYPIDHTPTAVEVVSLRTAISDMMPNITKPTK
jgi:hypothetical protein